MPKTQFRICWYDHMGEAGLHKVNCKEWEGHDAMVSGLIGGLFEVDDDGSRRDLLGRGKEVHQNCSQVYESMSSALAAIIAAGKQPHVCHCCSNEYLRRNWVIEHHDQP